MKNKQKFGGKWTIDKLNIFTNYLNSYTKALKNQNFELIYIDAFAGSGKFTTNDDVERSGSAEIALSTENKFSHYYFIEKNKDNIKSLKTLIDDKYSCMDNTIDVIKGDANKELEKLCNNIKWESCRALVFLDPYATQVNWDTLNLISKTKAVDLWYLFPQSALQRLLKKDGKINNSWKENINRILGCSNWFYEFYKKDLQVSLFDEENKQERYIKTLTSNSLQNYLINKLKEIFPYVADNPRVLYNTNLSPLFLFCFAIANPSDKAIKLSKKLSEHVLKL